MRFLSIDPSGSFVEGKGQSGWIVMSGDQIETFGQIRANDFDTREEYWKAHSDLIESTNPECVVIEDFRLYKTKAKGQTNSEMETSKLIGYLEMYGYNNNLDIKKQMASQAKSRFNDKILVHKKHITKDPSGRVYINGVNVSGHIVDALRHALFYQLIERKKAKQ